MNELQSMRGLPGPSRRWGTLICALSAFACAPAVVQAQLYKCVQDGKTVYQGERCPETAKQSTLREPPPVATPPEVQKAAEEKQAKSEDADLSRIAEVVAGYNVCTEIQPGFREKYAEKYNDWGTKNREAFKKYEGNPESVARMKQAEQAAHQRIEGEGIEGEAKKQALCARIIGIIQ